MFFDPLSPRHVGVNFGKWSRWTIIVLLMSLTEAIIDNVVGGDCVISGSYLYYLAGRVIKDDEKLQRRQIGNNTSKVFRRQFETEDELEHILSRRLDLKNRFENQEGSAPWVNIVKEDVSGFKQASLMYPQIVSRGGNNTGILVFGGVSSKPNRELLGFDAEALQFYVNTKGSSFIKSYAYSNSQNKIYSAPIYGSWIQSEETPTEFLLFGGIQLLNERDKNNLLTNIPAIDPKSVYSDKRVFKYSSKDRTWSVDSDNGQPSFMHSTIFYKEKMFVFGGINPQTLKPYPWSSLRIYNFKTKTWEINEIKGPKLKPRYGHRAIRVRDSMVIMGGIIGDQNIQNPSKLNFDDRILILDLMALKWTFVTSDNWHGSYLGCLNFYNDQLIYAFGLTNDQPTRGKTYIINTKTWKSAKEFSPLEHQNNYQLWFFLSCVGLILLLCIIIVGFFLHRHWMKRHPLTSSNLTSLSHEKPSSPGFRLPSPLSDFLWSNSVVHPNEAGESVMALAECSSENSLKISVSRRLIEAHLSSLDNGDINIENSNFNDQKSCDSLSSDTFFNKEKHRKTSPSVSGKTSASTNHSHSNLGENSLCTLSVISQFDYTSGFHSVNTDFTTSSGSIHSQVSKKNSLLKSKPNLSLDELEKSVLSPCSGINSKNSDTQSQFTILSAPFTPGISLLYYNSPRSPLNVHPDTPAYGLYQPFSTPNSTNSKRANSLHTLASKPFVTLPLRRKSAGLSYQFERLKSSHNNENITCVLPRFFSKISSSTITNHDLSTSSPEIKETRNLPSVSILSDKTDDSFLSSSENDNLPESSSQTTDSDTSSTQSSSYTNTTYSSTNSSTQS